MRSRPRSSVSLLFTSCAACAATAATGPVAAFSNQLPLNEVSLSMQEPPKLATRPKQVRRLPTNRRPKGYWDDPSSITKELSSFWEGIGVSTSSTLPPIPSQQLLNYFGRNDLRWAIYRHGGREAVSEWLGGAPIIPGRWKTALAESHEMRQLVLDPSNEAGRDLSPFFPPKSPQQLKKRKTESPTGTNTQSGGNKEGDADDATDSDYTTLVRWQHKPGRKPRGYWTEERVMVELLKYLYDYTDERGRPSVWMPRPSELSEAGRSDLMGAIGRFGGHRKMCKQLGLVPHNEWHYFEMQFRLILELREYLESTDCGGERDIDCPEEYCLPQATTILNDDDDKYQSLYDLIQYFGGRKFVASKLGLKLCCTGSKRKGRRGGDLQMSFGKFNLDFAIRLLGFIRNDHLSKRPPLKPATIRIPTRQYLMAMGETQIAEEIEVYGGPENVARRLGLDVF